MTAPYEVRVRELIAWGVDENPYRPPVDVSVMRRERTSKHSSNITDPMGPEVSGVLADLFAEQLGRADLKDEMQGLEWKLGLVDLRELIAFQRRLVFDPLLAKVEVPLRGDWRALVALAFGPPVPLKYTMVASGGKGYRVQSENPNLHMRPSTQRSEAPFALHGGSPFLEVGEYRGRWFLRDGYHRAYRLLQTDVTHVPAVIVRARTLAELGAAEPWFFPEQVLFSSEPPRVVDFLDDDVTMEYTRPRLLKTIRVSIEESVEPAFAACSPGEKQ